MRNPIKHLLVLICCVTLVFTFGIVASAANTESCPGSCVHQAAIGTTHYDTLAEAFTAATDGCTVTVLCDITDATPLTLDKAITLDLGEKTVAGQLTQEETLLHITKDLTLTNGTLTAETGTCLLASDCAVTIEKTARLTAAGGNAVELRGSGKLEIIGGEITAKEAAVVMDIADKKTMEASITGGKFLVEGDKTILITAGTDAAAPEDFVIGGTYNKLPTEHIPDYCRITDNGDGTYTVTAEYTVTFEGNGSAGAMTATKADRGSTITLPANSFTAPSGKHFKAWEIGGKEYNPGASFTVTEPVSLKALWASHSGGSASCTAKAVCSVCGSSYGDYAPHNYYLVSAYAATCTDAGMNTHNKCSTCGQLFVSGIPIRASSVTIPALGHQMHKVAGKEATCTEEGIAAHEKCDACGLIQLDGEAVTEEALVIAAAGHTLTTVPAVDATCTQTGKLSHEICTVCGEISLKGSPVEAEDLVTEMRAHVLSDWQSDASTHWKACAECGEVFRLHSHKDSDGNETCDDCGFAMPVPTETIPAEEADKAAFPFPILMIVAVVIAVGGIVVATARKQKQ